MLSTVDTMTPLAEGFCFGEGPRWFEGLLWFTDMLGEAVHTVHLAGSVTTLALPGHAPSGPGRRTLFLVSSSDAYPKRLVGTRLSCIDTVTVECPGAGLP